MQRGKQWRLPITPSGPTCFAIIWNLHAGFATRELPNFFLIGQFHCSYISKSVRGMEIVQICAGLEFHITWLVLGIFMAQGICQSNDLSYNDFG